jgi:hypothetical protein
MNNNHRVSRRFTRLSDESLNFFADSVVVAMTGNPTFPDPLVPLAHLTNLQQTFSSACQAAYFGGTLNTSRKKDCRKELLYLLIGQSGYVQNLCRNNLTGLLSSGFTNASNNRAQSRLTTPIIRKVMNEGSGKLMLRVKPVANVRTYQTQTQVNGDGWQEAGFSSQARRIMLEGLTPGTIYKIRVRALGGKTGASNWSDVISHMSL